MEASQFFCASLTLTPPLFVPSLTRIFSPLRISGPLMLVHDSPDTQGSAYAAKYCRDWPPHSHLSTQNPTDVLTNKEWPTWQREFTDTVDPPEFPE
ncbi:hypothetical protein [Pseudomonas fluorescens]|uniref:hypothetical protein n=1 Tax=Pseudomonas fluorescens TaxID=294 RepID=UPI00124166C4|nr:hypothetical protein [Pseudomonas fluorescens]